MLFRNESFRNFIDAVMLFGAAMETKKDFTILRVSRHLERRRSLAWLVAQLELHGISTKLCDTSDDEKVIYRTSPLYFSLCERARWYDIVGMKLPNDVEVTIPLLVVWSVKALSYSHPESDVKFCTPRAQSLQLDEIVRKATGLGFDLRLNETGIYIPASEREALGQRLVEHVPRAVWDVEMPVEID